MLTGEERVTFGTDFDVDGVDGGTSSKFVATGTRDLAFVVVGGVNRSFHGLYYSRWSNPLVLHLRCRTTFPLTGHFSCFLNYLLIRFG